MIVIGASGGLCGYSGKQRIVANGGVWKQKVCSVGVVRCSRLLVVRLGKGLILRIGSDKGILQTIRNDGAWQEIVTVASPSGQLSVQKVGIKLAAT